MKAFDLVRSPYTSLTFNAAYAIGNCIIGFLAHSWWFITVGAYYTVLAITRFSVLQVKRKASGDCDTELFARRITGILLVVLSVCIVGVNIMSAVKDRGTVFHEIVMITIATYTFTKITIAIIGMVKVKRAASSVLKTLRNISLADASVSIYTMQRSMLVSFPGMEAADILLLNIFTGTLVWIVVLLLGINLIGGKYIDMAKSKAIKVNKKIAEAVTSGYKVIEKGVVDGYKKIEQSVVGSDQNLQQIATMCGFSSDSHFIRTFTKYVGVTPGNCRRIHPGSVIYEPKDSFAKGDRPNQFIYNVLAQKQITREMLVAMEKKTGE